MKLTLMLRVIVVAWTIHIVMGATTYQLLGSNVHFAEHVRNCAAKWSDISNADLKLYAKFMIDFVERQIRIHSKHALARLVPKLDDLTWSINEVTRNSLTVVTEFPLFIEAIYHFLKQYQVPPVEQSRA